jgi:hypothetical protein
MAATRASIYSAVPPEAVDALASFMKHLGKEYGWEPDNNVSSWAIWDRGGATQGQFRQLDTPQSSSQKGLMPDFLPCTLSLRDFILGDASSAENRAASGLAFAKNRSN